MAVIYPVEKYAHGLHFSVVFRSTKNEWIVLKTFTFTLLALRKSCDCEATLKYIGKYFSRLPYELITQWFWTYVLRCRRSQVSFVVADGLAPIRSHDINNHQDDTSLSAGLPPSVMGSNCGKGVPHHAICKITLQVITCAHFWTRRSPPTESHWRDDSYDVIRLDLRYLWCP